MQQTPTPLLDGVVAPESGEQGLFAELGGVFVDDESVGQFQTITADTVQRLTEQCGAALLTLDPGSVEEGRLVPDVLAMAALERREPVRQFVPAEAGDGALHRVGPRAEARPAY